VPELWLLLLHNGIRGRNKRKLYFPLARTRKKEGMEKMPDILGKVFYVVPEFMRPKAGVTLETVKPIPGRCVWVHPKGRYAVLQFTFPEPVRECFTMHELGLI
jgi:hypothetical protein